MILGITGGVGAGKSTVLDYLKDCYGACLIECDEVARELQQPGEVCFGPMLELFSGKEDLLNPDGTLNRKTIAALVFAEEEVRESLNRIVHPAVKSRVREMIRQYQRDYPGKLIVVEAALLLEDRYGEICDEIWYIHADESVRRQRLKQSRGYSDRKITEIFSSQRTEESFRQCCNLTIDNSSENLQNTFRQIDLAMLRRGILPSHEKRNP